MIGVLSGPGIVADNNIFYPSLPRPIYAVGGYAYVQGYYPPAMQYPYVRSSGGWRCRGGYGECGPYGAARPHFYRAARFAPYGAQLYRGAPSARSTANCRRCRVRIAMTPASMAITTRPWVASASQLINSRISPSTS